MLGSPTQPCRPQHQDSRPGCMEAAAAEPCCEVLLCPGRGWGEGTLQGTVLQSNRGPPVRHANRGKVRACVPQAELVLWSARRECGSGSLTAGRWANNGPLSLGFYFWRTNRTPATQSGYLCLGGSPAWR